MNQLVSVCGLLCNECNYFSDTCNGCYAVKGSTFWAQEAVPDKLCPLYKCAVIENKFNSCGQCKELPCGKFMELKDPNISDEQHERSIKERVARLR